MYFNVSSNLITRDPSNSATIAQMDRIVAQAYASDGRGWISAPLVQARIGVAEATIRILLQQYIEEGVLEKYEAVDCGNCNDGDYLDPKEEVCPNCNNPLSEGQSSGQIRYRVIMQPQLPVFDPLSVHEPFDVFISYRHNEAKWLASDLYYTLRDFGKRVFLDSGQIAPGAMYERVFLKAASNATVFIALVSHTYFSSPYCKKELAHALRANRKVIPVQVGTDFIDLVPSDMSWLATINVSHVDGSATGLTPNLETYLKSQLQSGATVSGDRAFQKSACLFLLNQLGANELQGRVNQFDWLTGINTSISRTNTIQIISNEVGMNPTRLQELSIALRPE